MKCNLVLSFASYYDNKTRVSSEPPSGCHDILTFTKTRIQFFDSCSSNLEIKFYQNLEISRLRITYHLTKLKQYM